MTSPTTPVMLGDPFCVGRGGVITPERFLRDVAAVRPVLRAHDAVCNLAVRRYDFAVILTASTLNGQVTVLPSSRAEGAVATAVGSFAAPRVVATLDELGGEGDAGEDRAGSPLASPEDPTGEIHVFTSGSTGTPLRHIKTWEILAGGSKLTAEIIGRAGLEPSNTVVVGTTPHQHMYGLEASLVCGLAHGYTIWDRPVFYPSDLEVAAASAEALGFKSVVLVTSPPHLRFLEPTVAALPSVHCVISATAPLHPDLAHRLELTADRKVYEIYGSTETGSLGWRRPAISETWTLLGAFELLPGSDGWFAKASYLPAWVPLADEIEMDASGGFRLLGRHGDMIRIAGKRQSLGALNATLTAMPGISDAVVLREAVNGEDRLSILVVPYKTAFVGAAAVKRAVRRHMLSHFDPLFVPRRILLVDDLPRGETGKITARDLARLTAAASRDD